MSALSLIVIVFFANGEMSGMLLKDYALSNLVTPPLQAHTRITYHRTWETGLEVAASPLLLTPHFFAFWGLKYPNRQQFSATNVAKVVLSTE